MERSLWKTIHAAQTVAVRAQVVFRAIGFPFKNVVADINTVKNVAGAVVQSVDQRVSQNVAECMFEAAPSPPRL